MAGCPAGQTSSSKPAWTGAIIAMGLADIAATLNNIPTPWAVAFAGYLGLLNLDVDQLCGNPPPATPTITTADLAALFAPGEVVAYQTTVKKFSDTIANWLWPQVCECSGGGAPTANPPPAAPAVIPAINPPSLIPPTTPTTCGTYRTWFETNSLSSSSPRSNPWFSGQTMIAGQTLINMTVGGGDVNSSGASVTYTLTFFAADGVTKLGTQSFVMTGIWGTGNTRAFPVVVPLGTKSIAHDATTTSTSPVTWAFQVAYDVYCAGAIPGVASQPCCPPDPALAAAIDNIQAYLAAILSALPTQVSSWAEGTVHAGLSGNGTITLVGAALAVKVTITTDPVWLGESAGSPPYLYNRGFVVPVANEGPIGADARLVFNPQVFTLPALTEALGYSLTPGVVISITELLRGP